MTRLAVIEVYSDWCGPCKSIVDTLDQERKDTDDPVSLQFLRCKASSVEDFKDSDKRSQPLFFVYNNGVEIVQVEGPDGPALIKAVKDNFPQPDASVQDLEDNPKFVARRERLKNQAKET